MFIKMWYFTLHMISYMHFKGIKSVVSLSKSKKEAKYTKHENIIIQTIIHTQHICLSYFAIWQTYRTNYATFSINTLDLKVKIPFSQNNISSKP